MLSYIGQLFGMIIKIIVGGLTVIFMIALAGAVFSDSDERDAEQGLAFSHLYGDEDSDNYLLKLDVMGPIMGVSPFNNDPGPFGFLVGDFAVTYGYSVKEALAEAADDDKIKGVFIHMSSPGGTVFGSKAIFDGIKKYREDTGKPVVVYIEGLAASGGVMAMVGADAVYADAGSIVGSIGVIGGEVLYYDRPTALDAGILGGGVTTQGGIEQTIISAGRGKDLGNPYRRMTDEEKAVLQEGVDALYGDFVQHVSTARNIEPATITDKMGAQVFENRQAEAYELIDGTRSYDGAIEELATLAAVADDYQLVRSRPRTTSVWARLLMWGAGTTPPSAEQRDAILHADLCAAADQRALVYFGRPASLCDGR